MPFGDFARSTPAPIRSGTARPPRSRSSASGPRRAGDRRAAEPTSGPRRGPRTATPPRPEHRGETPSERRRFRHAEGPPFPRRSARPRPRCGTWRGAIAGRIAAAPPRATARARRSRPAAEPLSLTDPAPSPWSLPRRRRSATTAGHGGPGTAPSAGGLTRERGGGRPIPGPDGRGRPRDCERRAPRRTPLGRPRPGGLGRRRGAVTREPGDRPCDRAPSEAIGGERNGRGDPGRHDGPSAPVLPSRDPSGRGRAPGRDDA